MAPKIMTTVVELAGSIDPSLQKSISQATKALGGIDLKGAAMGAAVAAGVALAVNAISGMSKALIALEDEFGTAYDAIRVGTGATGDALRALEGDCKEVFKSMPIDVATAGNAIADYNTRLGLSGEAVQDLTKQAVALNKILGVDVPTVTEASSLAFQQWGIASDEMGKSFDYAFKVSQSTGVEITKLLGDVTRFGPAFKNLGYSFEESATLIGKLTKAGYNADEIMAAMKKSVGVLSKEGINAAEGFNRYYDAIKNARSETEATQYAMEIFGAKGGASMAAAIRSGALEIGDLTKELTNNNETIMTAFKDIEGLPEYLEEISNRWKTAFEPMAIGFVKILEDIMPPIMDVLDEVFAAIEKVPSFIKTACDKLQPVIQPVVDLFTEVLFPIAQEVYTAVAPVFETLQKTAAPLIEDALPVLAYLMSGIMNGIRVICGALGGVLVNTLNIIVPMIDNLLVIFNGITDFLLNVFTLQWRDAWQNIVDVFGATFGLIGNIVKLPLNVVIGAINSVIAGINAMKIQIPEWVPGMGGKAFSINVPSIPMLATGGFTNGVSIAGEDGQEAVISFKSAYRDKNIDIWSQAGEMLGVSSGNSGSSISFGDIVFAPQITSTDSSSASDILSKLKEEKTAFIEFVKFELRKEMEKQYV